MFCGAQVGRSTPIDYAGRFERMSRMSFSASALALLFVASASSASASSSTGLLLGSSTSSARPSLRPGGVLSTRLRGGGSRKVEFKVFHMPDARPALLAVGYAPSFSPKSFAGRNCDSSLAVLRHHAGGMSPMAWGGVHCKMMCQMVSKGGKHAWIWRGRSFCAADVQADQAASLADLQQVQCKDTQPGQSVAIVGGQSSLGNWKAPVKLKPDPFPTWKASIDIDGAHTSCCCLHIVFYVAICISFNLLPFCHTSTSLSSS